MCKVNNQLKQLLNWFTCIEINPQLKLRVVYFSTAVVSLLAILLKFNGQIPSPGQLLWAEDGNIFLNDANRLGLSALITPYAGYLHLFPRAMGGLASIFSLRTQPDILLFGWVIAHFIFIYSVVQVFKQSEYKIICVIAAVSLTLVQPQEGEIFLNITNSQWVLGAALFLLCLNPNPVNRKNQIVSVALAVPLSLTGPFSVILMPVVFIKLLLINDWKSKRFLYLAVAQGAAIQIYYLIISERNGSLSIEPSLTIWVQSLAQLLLLGSKDILQYFLLFAFWGSICYFIFSKIAATANRAAFLMIYAAVLMLIAGLMSHSYNPTAIVNNGSGNRYTWVPYTLIVVGAILAASSTRRRIIFVSSLMLIMFAISYRTLAPTNHQFYSYVSFSKVKDLTIPINPSVGGFPGWHVSASLIDDSTPVSLSGDSSFIMNNLEISNLVQGDSGDLDLYEAITNDPMMVVSEVIVCDVAGHVGVELTINRSIGDWVQVFFDQNHYFTEAQSLRRWYPDGYVVADFAFPYLEGGFFLRIDPMESVGLVSIESIRIYCLP
jgi:hypothetical protein